MSFVDWFIASLFSISLHLFIALPTIAIDNFRKEAIKKKQRTDTKKDAKMIKRSNRKN